MIHFQNSVHFKCELYGKFEQREPNYMLIHGLVWSSCSNWKYPNTVENAGFENAGFSNVQYGTS